MRMITLLSCPVLMATTGSAAAQTTSVGSWRPRPTIGVALGGFKAITRNGETNPMLSGTSRVPFSDKVRIRIEAARNDAADRTGGCFRFEHPHRHRDDPGITAT
jgi:hypothetical protein